MFFFLQILLKKSITSIAQHVLRFLAFLPFRSSIVSCRDWLGKAANINVEINGAAAYVDRAQSFVFCSQIVTE